MSPKKTIVITGGGPSGMAAALETVKHGSKAIVLERLDRVGGLARTVELGGSRYDIGPHRFFTMNEEVHRLFVDVGGSDIVRVPRLTRIYYREKYFDYPLTPVNALFGMGILNSAEILASYSISRVRRATGNVKVESFEDWIVDRFGRKLYETFFKTYTEKVWGIPCDQIGADWAAQRIKGLSLTTAVVNALFKPKKKTIKTLVDEFMYPRLGAGMLYEKMRDRITAAGGDVRTRARVVRYLRDGRRITGLDVTSDGGSGTERLGGDFYLSSAPLTEILEMMDPAPPPEVMQAVRGLRYRNHVGVKLEVETSQAPFPDNWIYVHSPDVRMARIANYRNFSKEMGRGPQIHPLTVEYFCFPGDDVWNRSDAELVELAKRELAHMKLVRPETVRQGFVIRSEKAYPVIERGFQEKIDVIKRWLDEMENFLPIGRSGMFKYNNQDHAMATGLLATRTALGLGKYDPWLVNIDGEYHEGGEAR
jgi:protoporphyrinogen oxidase